MPTVKVFLKSGFLQPANTVIGEIFIKKSDRYFTLYVKVDGELRYINSGDYTQMKDHLYYFVNNGIEVYRLGSW